MFEDNGALPHRDLLDAFDFLAEEAFGEAGELGGEIGGADGDLGGVRSGGAIEAVTGEFAGESGGGVLRGVDERDAGAEDALDHWFQERVVRAGEDDGIDLRGFHWGEIFLEDEMRGLVRKPILLDQ